MNVLPLGISSARLPPAPGRSISVSDAHLQGRRVKAEAAPAERVYVGEYVAASSNPTYFSRDDFFAVRQYGAGSASGGNRQAMVQAYAQNAGASSTGGRPSGRIDYFA